MIRVRAAAVPCVSAERLKTVGGVFAAGLLLGTAPADRTG